MLTRRGFTPVRHWQVRLFLAEDAPVLAGVTQHLLQQKQKLLVESLPPGFGKPSPGSGGAHAAAQTTAAVAWRVPGMVVLEAEWMVAAGDESDEARLQREREQRIFEAVYPRESSIPASPAEPEEAQAPQDDTATPIISPVPIDDDEGPEPDGDDAAAVISAAVVAASPAAPVTAAVGPAAAAPPSGGQEYDHELLVKLLSDPAFPHLPDVLEHMTATSAARDPALLLATNTNQLLSAAAPQGHSLRPGFQPPLPPGPPPARHLHNGNTYIGHPPPSTSSDVFARHPPAPMGVRFHDAGRAQPQPGPGLQHPDLLSMQHPLRQLQQQQPEAMFVQRGPVAELEQRRSWELSLPGGVGRSGQPPSAAPRLDGFASLGMGPGQGAPPPPLLPYPPMHPHFHEQHASLPLGVGSIDLILAAIG
eukprot:SM000239S08090  [mRNA]  locus=s239:158872:161167:- [translate_table: standard]